jgi:hypothetical protein
MRTLREKRPDRRSYNLRITKEEDEMIRRLRDIHCVNIPQLLRKTLSDLYERLEKKNE